MLDLINFITVSIAFNLLFFLYASSKMKNSKLSPVKTTLFAFLFNVPLSILLASVYTIMLIYAVLIGANEEWIWEYMEGNPAND